MISCSTWLRRLGITARCPATSASCCATSSAVAVPASSRAWITVSVCSASLRLLLRDRQPVLQRERGEPGVGDVGDDGERDHLLVEAAEQRRSPAPTGQGGAVPAPEIQPRSWRWRARCTAAHRCSGCQPPPVDGDAPVLLVPAVNQRRPDVETCCQFALPVASKVGSSGAPAIRHLRVRLPHPRDRSLDVEVLRAWPAAISAFSVGEPKPRHQSALGQRPPRPCARVARHSGGISAAGCGSPGRDRTRPATTRAAGESSGAAARAGRVGVEGA